MKPVTSPRPLGSRALLVSVCIWAVASSAYADAQAQLEALKAQFLAISTENAANFEKAQALEGTSDRAAFCSALKATIASTDRRVEVLHKINEVMQSAPGAAEEDKTYLANEEKLVQKGGEELKSILDAKCGQDVALADYIDATLAKIKDAEDAGKAHLSTGLALIHSGDKAKGCEAINDALKDYQSQLDLTHSLQDEFAKDKRTPADIAVTLQYSVGKLEGDIKDIQTFINGSCD